MDISTQNAILNAINNLKTDLRHLEEAVRLEVSDDDLFTAMNNVETSYFKLDAAIEVL